MVKLCQCVRECSFEKPDGVVKFLFLTHNQNARVCEELLKSMKDSDGLNDILSLPEWLNSFVNMKKPNGNVFCCV